MPCIIINMFRNFVMVKFHTYVFKVVVSFQNKQHMQYGRWPLLWEM